VAKPYQRRCEGGGQGRRKRAEEKGGEKGRWLANVVTKMRHLIRAIREQYPQLYVWSINMLFPVLLLLIYNLK
jgi:hypothetical protein